MSSDYARGKTLLCLLILNLKYVFVFVSSYFSTSIYCYLFYKGLNQHVFRINLFLEFYYLNDFCLCFEFLWLTQRVLALRRNTNDQATCKLWCGKMWENAFSRVKFLCKIYYVVQFIPWLFRLQGSWLYRLFKLTAAVRVFSGFLLVIFRPFHPGFVGWFCQNKWDKGKHDREEEGEEAAMCLKAVCWLVKRLPQDFCTCRGDLLPISSWHWYINFRKEWNICKNHCLECVGFVL